jgi:cell shape-determining protein MreD
MKQTIFYIFLFVFLIFVQGSFLNFTSFSPNLLLPAFLMLLFLRGESQLTSISLVLLMGLLLDVFSSYPFGTSITILFLIYIIYNLILKIFLSLNVIGAVFFIIFGNIFYNTLAPIFAFFIGKIFNFGYFMHFGFSYLTLIQLGIDLIFGLILFYFLRPRNFHQTKRNIIF